MNGLREKRSDIILLETWPIIASTFGVFLGLLFRRPVLNYVKDVYPESAEALNIIRPRRFVSRLLRAWDAWICFRSACVIAISETMREILLSSRRIAPERITVVQDWIEAEEFPQYPCANSQRQEMGISADTFIALFAGTMGLVSGVDVLIEVAKNLSNRADILILCVGQGMLKERMVAEAAASRSRNIRFEAFQPRERVPEMQAAANAMLLTITPGYPDTSVPSKLIGYLAAGRPVICAARSSSAVVRTVIAAGSSIAVQPGCADSIAAILHLADNRGEERVMGLNARRCFDQNFTSDRAFAEFARTFERVLNENTKTSSSGHAEVSSSR